MRTILHITSSDVMSQRQFNEARVKLRGFGIKVDWGKRSVSYNDKNLLFRTIRNDHDLEYLRGLEYHSFIVSQNCNLTLKQFNFLMENKAPYE